MYSEKLEKLIEHALADGVLMEKEKQVLLKNAEAEGVDPDEFEMVLEARLYEKTQQQVGNPVTDKQGKSDSQSDDLESGLKRKFLNFISSNPVLSKIILYLAVVAVGVIVIKFIISSILGYIIVAIVLYLLYIIFASKKRW
jgi:membrane-bound ClpP family serine protease